MNLIQPLDDLEWQTLIQNTAANFTDLTIKRGFQYYKQGRVSSLQLHDSGHIGAVVKGGEAYSVDIVPGSLKDSRCTCPVGKTCKHMVAVLLEAVNRQGRSVHALVNAHSTALIRLGDLPSAGTGLRQGPPGPPRRQNEEIARLKELASRLPEQPIAAWHELFQEATSSLGIHASNSLYARNALEAISRVKPSLADASDTLYELHARLFVLDRLVKQPQSSASGASLFMGYHVQMAADDIEKDIGRRFAAGQWIIRPETEPEMAERLNETLGYVRGKMLTEPRNHPFFSRIYRKLWMEGIHPYQQGASWYAEELRLLQSAEHELGSAYSRSAGMLAQSLMFFYLKQDQEAWDLLRAADKALYIQPQQLLHFLDALAKAKEWPRMKDWLIETGPLLASHRNHNLNDYMAYWDQAVEHVPGAERHLWDTLVEMLPYSKDIYQEALLARGEWKRWMDFQLSTGREPLEFRVSVLAPIEKEAPQLLLPFYHQAAERYIAQKNRSSYKAAVKLLKRLSKLYKKLKREDRWDIFITSFASRHSRLRALQEELRRGKLIS
ncbi:SWIM zinc finger family protein [Paenibacillus sp. DMB20]|uniref:SWIM zinc finger family protein n=1 Tax=Paenibacillus sp. DMB20 TaxID=1642570 RepID=UPI00062797E5|nr:SWIM zinc finger family protein [Paenibacillus sp. DMB20]KKO54876.1 hypothetical protein XI25_04045 [Paenibacillus sp. DMB20]